MRLVAQRLRDGRITVLDVPPPALTPETVLVEVHASLLSTGTERTKVESGRKSLIGKARARPDEVRAVVARARRDGIRDTVDAVRLRLDQPSPLGYSAAGIVIGIGERVRGLALGDRVACGGGGYALHAEIDRVPGNLCVRLPDGISFEVGAFATVGAVALHGVRRAEASLGERIAVVGLGLVGQLTCQILRAAGCRPLGVDLSDELVALALASGALDEGWSRDAIPANVDRCDAVLVTAATPSSDPIELAAHLCRDRGRVVVVGDVGLHVPRTPFYEKELELRLSRSYGPGRYDREYEERGLDYPIGYVRWTEQRNMAAFLELVAANQVDVTTLVRDRVPLERAPEAYERLVSAERSPLGIVLLYEPSPREASRIPALTKVPSSRNAVGFIGAGSFATRILIPAARDAGFTLDAIASAGGLSAHAAAERFGFRRATTPDELLDDPSLGVVVVATRHSSHAALATRALRAGKAVFVEKPPALTGVELAELRAARDETGLPLAVGFNRRFAPLAQELRDFVREQSTGPLELLYRVNAGRLEESHWLNDPLEGGGRLLGEGCHFIDFACWLVGALPERVGCILRPEPDLPIGAAQSFVVTVSFADGSLGTILYSARGAVSAGKEYIEVHAGGTSASLDDFRSIELVGDGRPRRRHQKGQDKGHTRQLIAFRNVLAGEAPIEGPDPLRTMGVTLTALVSVREGEQRDVVIGAG
jgi:predicted dehydrogenase/threonine dehydrogenase-like Zn-dependent dehydrogenase